MYKQKFALWLSVSVVYGGEAHTEHNTIHKGHACKILSHDMHIIIYIHDAI